MSDLLWPGNAGELFTDAAFLQAMVQVEQAWLDTLAEAGIAPATVPLSDLVGPGDVDRLAQGAEAGGNPVIGLVDLLRDRSGSRWVHRGLTSQDVMDTALVRCLQDTVTHVEDVLARQGRTLARLAESHRASLMVGRTLTQHAVPITFGLKAATWLNGVVASAQRLGRLAPLPAQLGGAAGTLAGPALLAGSAGQALRMVQSAANRLRLAAAPPWHTERTVLTEHADALVGCSDAWGHIAADVALLSRPEIAELREGVGGGSSTMPDKSNPVRSILVRRHALAAPALAATLHLSATAYVDERPDGAWHTEWDTLRTLARRTVIAAGHTDELLDGLVVDQARMAANAAGAAHALTAEQESLGGRGGDPASYLGANDLLIDAALDRARRLWKDLS